MISNAFSALSGALASIIMPFDTDDLSPRSSDVDEIMDDDLDEMDPADKTILSFIIRDTPLPKVFGCGPGDVASEIRDGLTAPDDDETASTLIMGFIQSGKSKVIFASCLFLSRLMKQNVIVVLRDFISDSEQFRYNFTLNFLESLRAAMIEAGHDIETTDEIISVHYAGDLIRPHDGGLTDPRDMQGALMSGQGAVVVALANQVQLLALNEILDRLDTKPTIFLDEVDDTLYTTGSCGIQMARLTERAAHVIGVSATVFDPLHDKRFGRVFLLDPPEDYKGVDRFVTTSIQPLPSTGGEDETRLTRDPDLTRFLEAHRTAHFQSGSGNHPMILLLKNERMINNQFDLLQDIRKMHGNDYTVIVYNGRSTTLFAPRLCAASTIRLPNTHKKARFDRTIGAFVFSRSPIQDVLQLLKNEGGAERFPRIIILSHDIIGRGINIVSRDFKWHLTHMFYRPSKTATLPMLLQSMRLAGVYRDNIPLRLYAEEKVLMDIMIGHRLQQEVVERIRTVASQTGETPVSILERQTFHPEKIPKRSVFLLKTRKKQQFLPKVSTTGEDGWPIEEFKKNIAIQHAPPRISFSDIDIDTIPALPKDEFDRLTKKMFPKWAKESSKIARFMREGLGSYGPEKVYTKIQITQMCKEYGVTFSHISKPFDARGWAFGRILIVAKNQNIILNPCLHAAFLKYF